MCCVARTGDALQRSDMSMTGVAAVTVIGSSSILQAHAGSRAAGPAASKAAVLVSSTFAGAQRMHNAPTQPAMWQGARLLLSRTAAAKPPALQVRHGRMQRQWRHCSALSYQHDSAPPLTSSRHAWAAALQVTCRTRCGRQGGSAAALPSWTIACSAASTYVSCMLTWAWQAISAASAAACRAPAPARAAQLPAASHTRRAMRRRQCCQRHRDSSAVLTELGKQHRASRPHVAACQALRRLGMLLALLLSFSLPQSSRAQSYITIGQPQWHLEESITYASKTGNSTAVRVPHLEWEIRYAATLPRRRVLLVWQLWVLLC